MNFTITKAKNLQHAIQSILSQVKNTTGKICLLVPDKLSVTLEKKLFETLNIESSFDIEVSTLTRLSNKILTDLGVNYLPISKLGSIILLKKILNENLDNLKLFNCKHFSYNYADNLFKTLTQFKASQINSNDMQIDKIKSIQLQNKIEDLSKILEEYENQKAGLVDQTDRLDLFAINISRSKLIKETNFFFVGFDNFTSQGYSVIEHLIKNALSVNVAVYENNLNFNFSSELSEHLHSLALKLNLPLKFYEEEFKHDKLHLFLADNLFTNSKKSMQIQNQISLKNAKSVSEEIEFVARDIREKIIDGKQFNNFGIACYDLEKYSAIISNIMEKYELNYYIDRATSLNNTFYYKFVINYIKLFLNNYNVYNVIQLINSEFIQFNQTTKLKLNKILKEIGYFPKSFSSFEEDEKELLTYINNLLTSFNLSKTSSLDEFRTILNSLFNYLTDQQVIDNLINKMTDNYQKKILMQEKDSLNLLFDEIETFYPNITLENLLEVLEEAGKELKINPIPQSIDCIQIIDATEILTDFDNLYIINCVRSTCPALMQDVGIILDSDIAELPFSKKLAPTIEYLNRLSKLKMFNSVQMFNESLTISMSNFSESDKSDLVCEIEKRFYKTNDNINEIEISNLEISPAINNEYHKILSKWDLIEFLSENSYSLSSEILKFYNIAPYENTRNLNNKSLEHIKFNEISCSALENYFKCPMNYFLSNVLHLEVERSSGIAMVDVGNMLHLLAKDFYETFNRNQINVEEFCKKKLHSYMTSDKKLSVFIDTPIQHNLIGEAVRFINHLKYMDEYSKFVPTFFEYGFDSKYNKSIEIADNIFLRGKIDRIDFFENYVRILDYKTGEVNASLKELYYGKKLQLFLYAKVASEIFDKQIAGSFYFPVKNSILNEDESSKYKLSGFYINEQPLATAFDTRIHTKLKSDLLNLSLDKDGNIKQDARSSKILSRDKFNRLMNYSSNISKEAVKQMQQGYIAASPIKFDDQSNSCVYCPYLSICRKNSMNIPFRSVKEVDLSSFGGNNG